MSTKTGGGRLRSLAGLMALGVCASVALLSWFGYRGIREWQHSARLLADRRASYAADLLVTALARDMRGVQDSVLQAAYWNERMLAPPYDVDALLASAFARYPYPESFVGWRGQPSSSTLVFFHRADRMPAWSQPVRGSGRFPVTITTEPSIATELAARISADGARGREFSVFETRIHDAPYQVVTRLLYEDPYREHLKAGLGFLVDLSWVQTFYFPELTNQVGPIVGARDGLALSIVDEGSRRVTEGTAVTTDRLRRVFPLLFVDPLLVALDRPADLPNRLLAVEVTHTDDPDLRALGALPADPLRTLVLAALSAAVLALSLAMMARAARASARLADMRSDFVSTMTHELKTPLATIRAVGESVASGRVTAGTMVREYAQLVVQESKRLTRIVDNSLAYSRITDVADAYHFEALDVSALVEEALHGFTSQPSAKDFEIEIDVPADLPEIQGDRTAMGLLLDNLIDNAVRYSGESRWLGLRAWRTSRTVHIAVADRGVGIPHDEIRMVVRKFVRGRRAGSGGSGLGLAIVSRIVEAHDGKLDILSAVGVGTTVDVALAVSDVTHDEANSGR